MEVTQFFSIVVASVLVSLASFAGGVILLFKKLQTQQVIGYLVSFAAGVMLTASFLDLLPESLEEAGGDVNIFLPVFIGILFFFFLERFVLWFHHHDDMHNAKPTGILILVGDGFHNFIDGIAIAAAFLTNPSLGVTTTLAIAAHEIPHEIADFSILISSGMKKTKALFYNFLSALTALVGAILGFYFLEHLEAQIPIFIAFTAGMFIYIASSDLIPEMHKNFYKQKSWRQTVPFILGIFLLLAVITFLEI